MDPQNACRKTLGSKETRVGNLFEVDLMYYFTPGKTDPIEVSALAPDLLVKLLKALGVSLRGAKEKLVGTTGDIDGNVSNVNVPWYEQGLIPKMTKQYQAVSRLVQCCRIIIIIMQIVFIA